MPDDTPSSPESNASRLEDSMPLTKPPPTVSPDPETSCSALLSVLQLRYSLIALQHASRGTYTDYLTDLTHRHIDVLPLALAESCSPSVCAAARTAAWRQLDQDTEAMITACQSAALVADITAEVNRCIDSLSSFKQLLLESRIEHSPSSDALSEECNRYRGAAGTLRELTIAEKRSRQQSEDHDTRGSDLVAGAECP